MLGQTYKKAVAQDISELKQAILSVSESSTIAVGSGGSYTIASLLCSFHELYTGRISRSSTPLELICNPTLASSSPVFLISAEGKNPDITEAYKKAKEHSSRDIHVITNRKDSLLMSEVSSQSGGRSLCFHLDAKDGYLATNSLLYDAVLIARAYGELDDKAFVLPPDLSSMTISGKKIAEWVDESKSFVRAAVKKGALTTIYSPLVKPIVADLESKLHESALLYNQVADLRSFAHGRHLWLAERPNDCAILSIIEPSLYDLWEGMRTLFPPHVETLTLRLDGSSPKDLIAGLVAQMHFVSLIAKEAGKDAGKPSVPDFGRSLYYYDLSNVSAFQRQKTSDIVASKLEVLGSRWPSNLGRGSMVRARDRCVSDLKDQCFKSIVFDYDGTLCDSQRRDRPPSDDIVAELIRLVERGVVVGVASGRGGSMRECLKECLPKSIFDEIQMALYNGGLIGAAGESMERPADENEFISHVARLVVNLEKTGVPIQSYRVTHPYQVSVRFKEGVSTDYMWFVIADALRQDGLNNSSIVKSKHSVDILAPGVNKSKLVGHIIEKYKVSPYEIITIGDQGAWPGNDSSLLEHKYSLSVNAPSRRLDRGWNLAPASKKDVEATLWYIKHFEWLSGGRFYINF